MGSEPWLGSRQELGMGNFTLKKQQRALGALGEQHWCLIPSPKHGEG